MMVRQYLRVAKMRHPIEDLRSKERLSTGAEASPGRSKEATCDRSRLFGEKLQCAQGRLSWSASERCGITEMPQHYADVSCGCLSRPVLVLGAECVAIPADHGSAEATNCRSWQQITEPRSATQEANVEPEK
jgi:hypothetical protein